jgi:neutral ceramidase
MARRAAARAALAWCALSGASAGAGALWAGVGIADSTGPVADVNFMGYALPQQVAGGIHTRLYARALVVAADAPAPAERRVGGGSGSGPGAAPEASGVVAFVSVDNGMGSWVVTREAVARLQAKYPGVYSQRNVCVSGTHTHSAAAGFLQNFLFQVTSLGFVHEAFEAYVNGVVEAVSRAHESARAGRRLSLTRGDMAAGVASINRSPSAYLENPAEERARYAGNTDLEMTVLRVDEADGTPVSMFNWFAVHGTTLPNTNKLVSGDNKGYASLLFEGWLNAGKHGAGSPQGFVAAFAATNLGDVSPNINGTFCSDSGLPCEELHSTCGGRNENCHGRGPSADPYESVAIIGSRQAALAKQLFEADHPHGSAAGGSAGDHKRLGQQLGELAKPASASGKRLWVEGAVSSVHAFRDMTSVRVRRADGSEVTTCKAALGYSFAAGTTDGPGQLNFVQAENRTQLAWELFRDIIVVPSKELQECQHPKPVLLPTGEVSVPYPWDPSVVPLQMFKLGRQLVLVNVPSEYTTMAGRRLRAAVRAAMGDAIDPDAAVVIAGLSNDYSSYVTTAEEFALQRYEAASTLFGPHTLEAYTQELTQLSRALAARAEVADRGREPEDLMDRQVSLLPKPGPDWAGMHGEFGKVLKDVGDSYDLARQPALVVAATFQAANPRHDPRPGGTFLAVERKVGDDQWVTFRTDADLDTRFVWRKVTVLESEATVEWRPSASQFPVPAGTYRLAYFGDRKLVTGGNKPFEGRSKPLTLAAPPTEPTQL